MENFFSFILTMYPGLVINKNTASKKQIAELVANGNILNGGTYIDPANETYIMYGIKDDNTIVYTDWLDFNDCLFDENNSQIEKEDKIIDDKIAAWVKTDYLI